MTDRPARHLRVPGSRPHLAQGRRRFAGMAFALVALVTACGGGGAARSGDEVGAPGSDSPPATSGGTATGGATTGGATTGGTTSGGTTTGGTTTGGTTTGGTTTGGTATGGTSTGGTTTGGATGGGTTTGGGSSLACNAWLSVEAATAGALDVRALGARGDGVSDDTAAIQAAIDGLQPGQWLVFPAGRYLHASRLVVTRPGVTLDGRAGATLHATNPDDQAILIQADGVRVIGFTMTAITDQRRLSPWHSRIAVWRDGAGLAPVNGVRILNNRIVESGDPGTPGANGASSAGIFVDNARDFVIAGNVVHRSLADGIQVIGGSRGGQVLYNRVRETGDDMIGIVSYLVDEPVEPSATVAAQYAARRESQLVRDILVADNDLAGGYWGRGIAVVGAEDVSVLRNTIDTTSHAAAVYVAREQGFGSFGVRNVRVQGNQISRVQTDPDVYSVLDPADRDARTGHGAIELVAHIYDEEAQFPVLQEALRVRQVLVQDNQVRQAAAAGLRMGYGFGLPDSEVVQDAQGRFVRRPFNAASVSEVALVGNRFDAVDEGLDIFNAAEPGLVLACSANLRDGQPVAHPICSAQTLAVTGSAQACVAVPR